ncbi:MAG: HPr family phosphocarrier protein [Lachnospiraceae bacterium]|nr:HPr family phosphocarrier protein [Lachnospiraceae bacterium]
MQQVHIRFHGVDQVRQFVNIVNTFDTSFDLGSGQRIVDAKSILGIMALDLSGPLRLRYHSKDAADDMEIAEKIAPFMCAKS